MKKVKKNQKTLFSKRVEKVVLSIPKGETLTYGQVAEAAGSLGAARAVGNLMKKNYKREMPCHRVIKAGGNLGNYNGLKGDKRKLLKKEGAI